MKARCMNLTAGLSAVTTYPLEALRVPTAFGWYQPSEGIQFGASHPIL